MKTEQYVVTCAPKEIDRPYFSKFGSSDSDVYKFYGVRKIKLLEDYEKEAYKYAWDFARMITDTYEHTGFDYRKVLGVSCISDVFKMPFDTVLKKYQEWDDRIKVGDVCIVKRSGGTSEKVIVISESYMDDIGTMYRVLCPDHLVRNIRPKELTKTDQHFDVDLIFEALNKEDAE